jgi:hypothetical protein
MEPLLIAIVVWLSANLGLPATYDLPRVERMSSIEMANLVYDNVATDQHQTARTDQMRKVLSLYRVDTKTIYLPPEWSGRTPADLSLLVHEMVHHLQNLSPPPSRAHRHEKYLLMKRRKNGSTCLVTA